MDEMSLLLGSPKIHFFHLLGDFWNKSKGSSRSSNLPSLLKLSCDRDLKVLNASKLSEKSQCFFWGQLCNLSEIFFWNQRSTVRKIENLKKLIRPSPSVLDLPKQQRSGCFECRQKPPCSAKKAGQLLLKSIVVAKAWLFVSTFQNLLPMHILGKVQCKKFSDHWVCATCKTCVPSESLVFQTERMHQRLVL